MTADEARALVDQGIQRLTDDPAQWRRWADTLARFHDYSAGNVLLILTQRPDATYVTGYHAWQALGRQVRRGEHGLTILAPVTRKVVEDDPLDTAGQQAALRRERQEERRLRGQGSHYEVVGFRAVTVFDIAQTAGRPLDIPAPKPLTGDLLREVLPHLLAAVPAPVRVLPAADLGPAHGWWDGQVIALNAGDAPDQQVKTLLHEWAHSLGPRPQDLTPAARARQEVVAETSAYVTARMLGLDTEPYSRDYVAHWSQLDPQAVRQAAGEVAQRVRQLVDRLEEAAAHDPVLAAVTAAWRGPRAAEPEQDIDIDREWGR